LKLPLLTPQTHKEEKTKLQKQLTDARKDVVDADKKVKEMEEKLKIKRKRIHNVAIILFIIGWRRN
jgi:hypothetical protein